MQSSIFIAVLSLAAFLVATYPSSSEAWIIDRVVRRESNCIPCMTPEDCNHDLQCKHGEAIDECGRKYCPKGPDEKCGVRKGKCAKGLICTDCGLCGGCASKSLECAKNAYDCLLPSAGFY